MSLQRESDGHMALMCRSETGDCCYNQDNSILYPRP